MNADLTPKVAHKPPHLFISPQPFAPFRAAGGIVMDATGFVVANCPNGQFADFVAWSLNNLNGVHD